VYEKTGIPVGWFMGNTTMISALRIINLKKLNCSGYRFQVK
jgi:hypothetical protein